jgi:DNA-binding IclR family transcriptional regulator
MQRTVAVNAAHADAHIRPDVAVPQYPIESVDKVLRLIRLLGDQPEIRLSEAARYLGVASSTAHRLLAMLHYRGLVRQDPETKAYRAGPALINLTFAVFGRLDVESAARPIMRSLSETLRETVHLGMLDCAAVRFIAAVEAPTAVRVASRLGQTLPAHCTSSGKVMLANLSDNELALNFPNEALQQVTPHSLHSRAALFKELAEVRARGYATNREESEEGVASVAVPVVTCVPGLRLALNMSAPVHRLKAAQCAGVAETLARAASQIGDRLG